jgi:hypothetical protein
MTSRIVEQLLDHRGLVRNHGIREGEDCAAGARVLDLEIDEGHDLLHQIRRRFVVGRQSSEVRRKEPQCAVRFGRRDELEHRPDDVWPMARLDVIPDEQADDKKQESSLLGRKVSL